MAKITGITFDYASIRTEASNTDNFPTTWAADGHQYSFGGDGFGWGNNLASKVSWGAFRIEGDFNNYTGHDVYVGPNGGQASIIGKTHQQPMIRQGILYAWLTPGSNVAGFDESRLYKSIDFGLNWVDTGVSFNRLTHGINHMGFIQYGQDHAGPAEVDGYYYFTCVENQQSTNLIGLQTPGNIFLLRVPISNVENQASYEWFTGDSTTPTWGTMANRTSTYTELAGLGSFPQLQYVTGLKRYTLWLQWDGTNKQGPGSSNLLLLEAPEPWGPWTEVDRSTNWGGPNGIEDTVFQWQLMPKWERTNGVDFTLLFTGTSTNDAFRTLNGSFVIDSAVDVFTKTELADMRKDIQKIDGPINATKIEINKALEAMEKDYQANVKTSYSTVIDAATLITFTDKEKQKLRRAWLKKQSELGG